MNLVNNIGRFLQLLVNKFQRACYQNPKCLISVTYCWNYFGILATSYFHYHLLGISWTNNQNNTLPPLSNRWCNIPKLCGRPGIKRIKGSRYRSILWQTSEENNGERKKSHQENQKKETRGGWSRWGQSLQVCTHTCI